MTEAEWDACADPTPMLEFLLGKTSERKVRLYLCGGCRHIAHLFFRPHSLTAVEVSERFADGDATKEELKEAHYWAESPTFGYHFDEASMKSWLKEDWGVVAQLVEMNALAQSVLFGGEWRVNEEIRNRLLAAADMAYYCTASSPRESPWGLRYLSQVDWPRRWLIDCVFGNPFRAAAEPTWFTWNDGAIRKIAQSIYNDRAFDRLPLLADALEDAGCTDADILSHCREPGEHVRGCWVVDLLTGRA
jgi:hypothetical protein